MKQKFTHRMRTALGRMSGLLLLLALLLSGISTSAQEVFWKEKYEKRYKNGYETTVRVGMGLYNQRSERWASSYVYEDNGSSIVNYSGVYYYFAKGSNGLWGVVSSKHFSEKWHIANQYNRFDFSYFSQNGALQVQKGQDWGVIDVVDGTVLIPIKWKQISNNEDVVYCTDWNGKEVRYSIREQRSKVQKQKAEQLAKQQAEAKAQREATLRQAMEQRRAKRLASFTRYATDYVQPIMSEWQKKGEFEKLADYTKRVSGEKRQRKIDELTREAERKFIEENRAMINLRSEAILGTYDSENETFPISTTHFGRLLIPVPIAEGPAFQHGFSGMTFTNERYFIEADKIALASFDVRDPQSGRTYHYSNTNALNYSQYHINPDDLNLESINIITGVSSSQANKPKVRIIAPTNGSTYTKSRMEFRLIVSNGDGTSHKLYAQINGAPKVEIQPVVKISKGARAQEGELYEIDLPVNPGKPCYIAFSAVNDQNISSETQEMQLLYAGAVIKPKLILFAVGVGDYKSDDLTKLRFAAKDANDFVKTIEACNREDYTELIQYKYIDKEATSKNIRAGLNKVVETAQQGDVVLFYFSGHGVQDGEDTYFMTIDAAAATPDDGLDFRILKKNMKKLVERQVKVVTFMDACHSGAMAKANTKGAPPKLTELEVDEVIEFYSSTAGEESAEDEKLQNGVFTAGLIEGLRGKASHEGYITVNTLRQYITRYVNDKNPKQRPLVKGVDAGDITLFRTQK